MSVNVNIYQDTVTDLRHQTDILKRGYLALKGDCAMMPDSCFTGQTGNSIRGAESSPTENSSLSKYTNLDPCCYGNLLLEFHHQSNLRSVAAGHAYTSHRLADCDPTPPAVGYLLPLCQPPIFLPSHIVKSPMGTLFLLPHHLSLFSLLLGEKGDRKKSNEHRGCGCTEKLAYC